MSESDEETKNTRDDVPVEPTSVDPVYVEKNNSNQQHDKTQYSILVPLLTLRSTPVGANMLKRS